MENKCIDIEFPNKLLRFELKEYLEYNFKVYIRKSDTHITIFGNSSDLANCQEQAEYFKSVDAQFLLHLNEYSKEALSILSLKLFFQSKCKVLMSMDCNVLYIFGLLYNVTCLYNYLCYFNNKIEKEFNFELSEIQTTDLNVLCRILNVKLPANLSLNSKLFIYFILKYSKELFVHFDKSMCNDSNNVTESLENLNLLRDVIPQELTSEKIQENLETSENDALCLLQPNQDTPPMYRTIIIDGYNVAMEHGTKYEFSPIGIKIVVDYFVNLGHSKVFALLPRHRQPYGGDVFSQLELSDHLKYSPSRVINKVRETSCDCRFILDAAIATDGMVVSNDQYRDLMSIDKYKDVIYNRLIRFSFVDNRLIIFDDSRGINGSKPRDMLSFPDRYLRNKSKQQHTRNRAPKTHSLPVFNLVAKGEMNDSQKVLFEQACGIFPDRVDMVREIILSHPDLTDLNTIINFCLAAFN